MLEKWKNKVSANTVGMNEYKTEFQVYPNIKNDINQDYLK